MGKEQSSNKTSTSGRSKSQLLNTDPTRALWLTCSKSSRDRLRDPCCKAAEQTRTLRAEQLSSTKLLSWGQERKFSCFFFPSSPAKPALQGSPSAAVLAGNSGVSKFQVPWKVSGREGWEDTSQDRLRHRYNRKDGPAVGALEWDVGGFFSALMLYHGASRATRGIVLRLGKRCGTSQGQEVLRFARH